MEIRARDWKELTQFHQIEVIAYWEGKVTARQVKDLWNISSSNTALEILRRYREITGGNLVRSNSRKGFVPTAEFKPV